MRPRSLTTLVSRHALGVTRRSALRRLIAGGGAAILAGYERNRAVAQEATPAAGQCVATAPPTEEGIGFASLLVGGIIHDMPSGPVEIRISRFTLEPGAGIPPMALPYPAMMYIETGASSCPGGPGKIMYGADGTVLAKTTEEGIHVCPAGTTWYIPAGVADGADNEGTELMSSLVIEFVPVEQRATPTAGTPSV